METFEHRENKIIGSKNDSWHILILILLHDYDNPSSELYLFEVHKLFQNRKKKVGEKKTLKQENILPVSHHQC